MALLAIDLGGTKLAAAIFTEDGKLIDKQVIILEERKGKGVGELISVQVAEYISAGKSNGHPVKSIGVSVPGISNTKKGTVWAPNIPGWDDYPLLHEVKTISNGIPVVIESDRTCYIAGELWQGNAKGCNDAIFLSVGTGIGAGILAGGRMIRGANGIAGAIGWTALQTPFRNEYTRCGCFEYYASGEGIANQARHFLKEDNAYHGELTGVGISKITAHHVFAAFDNGDMLAAKVIDQCIQLWGMTVANLVSLFNPEIIILGGGIFGPAIPLIPAIKKEAARWAQPVGIHLYELLPSGLAGDAGLYGAGYIALQNGGVNHAL